MTDDWERVRQVFDAALERPSDDRDRWLHTACGGDPALLSEIRALLSAHDRVHGILDSDVDGLMPSEPQAAGTVGRYKLLDEAGRGGMGVVYRAHDPQLDRIVALKFLPAHLQADRQAKARFLDEARAASSLDHPGICTIHDIGETEDGQLYIAMAYYEGATAADMVTEGPLEPDRALRLAGQAAEAMASAHDIGILHRDLKPANLLVTPGDEVRILDFGVAKLPRDYALTMPGVRLGTLAYMSPEQARGEAVDARADVWALGAVLYEMLTGRRPFLGGTDSIVRNAILQDDPPAMRDVRRGGPVPDALARELDRIEPLIRRALAKHHLDRFVDAGELAEAIAALRRPPLESGRAAPPGRPLPAPVTRFIGRGRELARLRELLATARLVTLTGPGGTGKTRIALEGARSVEKDYDAVCFVPLAAVTDVGLVRPAIAQALGLPTPPGSATTETLRLAIAERRVLLMLDNFEQVVDAAGVVSELLSGCPGLTVLVTSRIVLHIGGEHAFPLPPLELPAEATDAADLERSAATALFLDRARALRPDFSPTGEEAAAVAAICRRLEGIPLAIELAAARTRTFSPRALLRRLDESMDRRLDVLSTEERDRPERHRTLRRAVAWSYDLLEPDEQRLFRRLGVFAGGFSPAAVADVTEWDDTAESVLPDLERLADRSLIAVMESPDGEPRFAILDTLRAYALDLLRRDPEHDSARYAHAAHYARLAERAEPELTGPDAGLWLDRLQVEHDNLRAALAWTAARKDAVLGLRIATAVWRLWLVRGFLDEGRHWLETFLGLPAEEVPPRLRARALNATATIVHNQGANLVARTYLEEALELWRATGDRSGLAASLNNLAWVACETTELELAESLSDEALELCRELGDRRGEALALNNLGWIANYRGEARPARDYLERSAEIRREIGDRRGVAFALINLSWAARQDRDFDRSARCLGQADTILDEVGDEVLRTWWLVNRGALARSCGDLDQARQLLHQGLDRWERGGNRSLRAHLLTMLGGVERRAGQPGRASALFDAAEEIWHAIQCGWGLEWVARERAGAGRQD